MHGTVWSLLRSAGVVSILASGCAVDLGMDSPEEAGRGSSPIVNGQATTDFPTTGILMVAGSQDQLVCSGTLIGCDRFLTAAHCVCAGDGASCQDSAPSEPLVVYLQNAGFFTVTAQHVHPDFVFPDSDVAVLELGRPVTGLRPSALPSAAPTMGQSGVIVGFGRSGGGEQDFGIKQYGSIVTAECPADASGPGHVCWRFQGNGANTCNGDSGGPLFIDDPAGGIAVAGITSGGIRNDCLAGDHSYDNEVFWFADYIADVAGGRERLAAASCGDLPHVGEPGAAVASQQGTLGPGESADFEVEVPAGTAELRVSLNSTEGSNPDLFIRAGGEASEGDNDCAATTPSSYGFCQVSSPLPGRWHLLVRGIGAGDFQLTSTTLAGAPVATGDSYDVDPGKELVVEAKHGVLANDAGVGRGPLRAEVAEEPEHGRLELYEDGSFRYLPDPDHAGGDAFTYRASDGSYAGSARVDIEVVAPPEPIDDGETAPPEETVEDGGCAAGGAGGPGAGLFVLIALVAGRSIRPGRTRRRRRARSP
jgi:hypothetical protein